MYGSIKVGLPDEPGILMGPVINAAARDRCERYVALAEEHGGKVAFGGGRPAGFERGYWFEPTVLDLPDNANPAAQDEIFGPVIGVIGYDDVDDAVRHRQRQPLRAVGPGVRRRRRRGHGRRPAAPRRGRQRQHVAVQRLRARRGLQAERPRPRARASRASATSRRSSTS